MIVYFADRHLNILGQASTHLKEGVKITDDLRTDDVELGLTIFEAAVNYDKKTRSKVQEWTALGNYVIFKADGENKICVIAESEENTKKQYVDIYAEDSGLELINEIAEEYEADRTQPVSFYIEKYTAGSGWEIGINEVEGLTRKLSFDSEETVSARLLKIAEAFNDCEISYSFEIKGLSLKKKLINIYEKRGKDTGVPLRVNKEIDGLTFPQSIMNLATALKCSGGTPDNAENPITLSGYSYDDKEDFYIDGKILKSRVALEKWSRYLDASGQEGGHITKMYSDNSLSQQELLENAIAELKKLREPEINYEADIQKLPDGLRVGDRVDLIDDAGGIYVNTRLLTLEVSECNNTRRAVFGEHLIKGDGISAEVKELAAEFAKQTQSVKRAETIAGNAVNLANDAKTTAESVKGQADNALEVANKAKEDVAGATESANNAQALAQAAQAAANKVEADVAEIATTVENAHTAAQNAYTAATTAETKANEAKEAAENALEDAEAARAAVGNAQTAAENATAKATAAETIANAAKTTAEAASTTAQAAKEDAEQAAEDIETWKNNLETYKQTVSNEYTRKTELTETTATLQSQITSNANELSSVHSSITRIDETANNAAELAGAAFYEAEEAQAKATEAAQAAEVAQTEADTANLAAENAQAEADIAKQAAATAQGVADKAQSDLEAAIADLATVQDRADATEEEIAAAELAVQNARTAATNAQAQAAQAATIAKNAQAEADTAVTNAVNAQNYADYSAKQAEIAQQAAEKVNQSAAAKALAQAQAAQNTAESAQSTANTAKTNADTAQSTADQAAQAAALAQQAADNADEKAAQAEADLETARQNLESVTSRVGATEAEVEAAKSAVTVAQAAADKAKQDAEAAQNTADKAKQDAVTAQQAADNAKTAADNAQKAADDAQAAADKAQQDVNNLTVRVTTAETEIVKNSEEIALRAKKTEVEQTLGGYYTKTETDSKFSVEADRVNSKIKKDIEEIQLGGRNLLYDSKGEFVAVETDGNYGSGTLWNIAQDTYKHGIALEAETEYTLSFDFKIDWGNCTPITPVASVGIGATPGNFEADISGGTASYYNYGKYYTKTEGNFPLTGRLVFTFTTPNAETLAAKPYFAMRPARTSTATALQGATFTCLNFKLEKGIIATDWTPAPEDVSSDIEDAATVSDDMLARLSAVESEITQLAENISMLVRKGDKSSQMVFDEESTTWSFDTGEIDENISQHTTDIETLKENAAETAQSADELKDRLDNFEEHIKLTTYEDEPCQMYYEDDSNVKQYTTNSRRIITETVDGEEIVKSKVDVDTAEFKKVIATEESQIGGFAWVGSNNHLSLVWKE